MLSEKEMLIRELVGKLKDTQDEIDIRMKSIDSFKEKIAECEVTLICLEERKELLEKLILTLGED